MKSTSIFITILAIEEAINNTINDSVRYTDQKIYSVNVSGAHVLGKFDKVAVLNNQTWVFNYITGNESFTNTPSTLQTVNVWENKSLSYDEIRGQVEILITSTRT